MNDSQPILEVQPVVIPAQYFVKGPLIAGFASLFPGIFTFVISNMIAALIAETAEFPVVRYGLAVYVLSFMVVMFLVYLKMYQEPKKTRYRIFRDKLEYYEGFMNRRQRTVIFDQVIDVQLSEGLLQQTKGAGSVVMITQQLISTGTQGQLSNRNVVIQNIPDPVAVYDLIRSLAIDKNKADQKNSC